MNDTAITLNESQEARLATGHDVAAISTSNWDLPTFAGAGALRSTASDMAIYLAVNMGVVESPLSKAIDLSQKFQRAFQAEHLSIGYAWLTTSSPGSELVWHNGATGGYRSFIGFDKVKSIGVVVLANSQDDADFIATAFFSDEIDAISVEKFEDANVSIDELNKFEGDYKLARNFLLTISAVEGRLFAQATGQQKFPLFSRSGTEFYFKAVDASINFNVDRKGEVRSLVLHQNGKRKAKKIR
jgi:CubicO group peptidase (beta-lactamase class C family)